VINTLVSHDIYYMSHVWRQIEIIFYSYADTLQLKIPCFKNCIQICSISKWVALLLVSSQNLTAVMLVLFTTGILKTWRWSDNQQLSLRNAYKAAVNTVQSSNASVTPTSQ